LNPTHTFYGFTTMPPPKKKRQGHFSPASSLSSDSKGFSRPRIGFD
jgi:hypothetical protein